MTAELALRGGINRRRFLVSLGIAFLIFNVILVAMILRGMAMAMPLAGIGGITLKFDKLNGQGLLLETVANDTSEQASVPMGRARIDKLTIYNLQMIKELNVAGRKVKVVMTVPQIDVEGLVQDMTLQECASADADDQLIDESQAAKFQVKMPTFTFLDCEINAHYLFQKKAKLHGVKMEFKAQ